MDYTDEELLKQLEDARLADMIHHSPEWRIIHDALKRLYEIHVDILIKTDPNDFKRIHELQQICKLYSEDFLPALILRLRQTGDAAYEVAEKEGILEGMLRKLDHFIGIDRP